MRNWSRRTRSISARVSGLTNGRVLIYRRCAAHSCIACCLSSSLRVRSHAFTMATQNLKGAGKSKFFDYFIRGGQY